MNNNDIKIKAKELFDKGIPLKEIAENLGINYNTLKYWKSQKFALVNSKNDSLSEQEEMFCILVADTNNIYNSAIKSGYSETYAHNTIYQLMKKPKIKKKIASLKKIKQISLGITKEDILMLHKEIAFSRDVEDCFDYKTGKLKNNVKNIKKFKIEDTEYGKKIAIELEDRAKSIDFLTKYMELDPQIEINKDKIKLEKLKLQLHNQERAALFKLKEIETAERLKLDTFEYLDDLKSESEQWIKDAWADEWDKIEQDENLKK